jgi:hypothetical protein
VAVAAQDITTVNRYANGVRDRINHDAPRVARIFPVLLGYTLCYAESDSIRSMERQGNLTNVTWFTVRDNGYAFACNHRTAQIELREPNLTGPVIESFDNDSDLNRISRLFESLAELRGKLGDGMRRAA